MRRRMITFPDGRQVCPLGQGTYQMGRRRSEEIQALRRGIDLGLTLIDTAEMYGTEDLVGEAVRECRDKAFIVSKVMKEPNVPANGVCNGSARITSTFTCCTGSDTTRSPRPSVLWRSCSRKGKSGNGV